ncbi:MAG TPA: tetratricopeptide repeat protein, partial [Balneolaceae bacterium]|nr:tetratricopeptide repeat protein [Balneolaceae bacterium]
LSRQNFGADHPTTMKSQSGLANLLAEQENYQKADSLLQEVVSVRRERLGEEHPLLAQSLYELASVQYRAGGYESAARLSREALQIQQATLPEGHRRTALTQSLLGACLTDQQRYTEAEPLLDKSYALLSAQRGPQDKDTRQALQRLVNLYEAWDKPEKAALYRAESAADS